MEALSSTMYIMFPLSPPLSFLQNQKMQKFIVFSVWKVACFIATFLIKIYSSKVTVKLFPNSYSAVGLIKLKANTILGFRIINICHSFKAFFWSCISHHFCFHYFSPLYSTDK